jgi:U3 small nucleolar RNA-associated protein 6
MIVARRRESEYLLKRRAARKADFLRYIEAEMQLEKLRVLRTKQVWKRQHDKEQFKKKNNDNNKPSTKQQHNIGDAHIIQHIHFLFTRVIRKFKSDLSLRLQHAEFCKQARSYLRLSRVYAEALQIFPRNSGLWIEAASLEFFGIPRDDDDDDDQQSSSSRNGEKKVVGGGAVQPARVLLQRGLRINPTSQELWLQYFCMELHHLQKLRGRREILQLTEEKVDEEEGDLFYQDATIPIVVFDNAIKAIPDNVTFRLQFLDVCSGFPETEKLEAHVMETITRDFEDEPAAWIARAAFLVNHDKDDPQYVGFLKAQNRKGDEDEESSRDDETPNKRQRLDDTKHDDPVLSVLSTALDKLPTSDMYLQSIRFLRSSYLPKLIEDGAAERQQEVLELLWSLTGRSTEKAFCSTELVKEVSDYHRDNGNPERALNVLQEFALGQKEVDFDLWLQWASLCCKSEGGMSAERVLRMALDRSDVQEKTHVDILLELFGALLTKAKDTDDDTKAKQLQQELLDLFQRILLLSGGRDVDERDISLFCISSVSMACLAFVRQSFERSEDELARNACDMVLSSTFSASSEGKSPAQVEAMKHFFDCCIEFEKSQSKDKEKSARKKARRRLRVLLDSAIHFFEACAPSLSDEYTLQRDNEVRFC